MRREATIRLVLALALSVAVHLSLIYGIAVGPGELAPGRTIVARLASAPVAARRVSEARRAQREATLPVASGDRGQAAEFKATEPQTAPEPVSLARPEDSALPHVDVPLIIDPAWYAASDLDLFPRPMTPVNPEYPESAAGISGAVSLLLKIDEFGAVQEVTVVNAEPAGYFEDSASRAFKAAHFSPAQRDGRPVRSRIVVKVRFEPQVQASAVR